MCVCVCVCQNDDLAEDGWPNVSCQYANVCQNNASMFSHFLTIIKKRIKIWSLSGKLSMTMMIVWRFNATRRLDINTKYDASKFIRYAAIGKAVKFRKFTLKSKIKDIGYQQTLLSLLSLSLYIYIYIYISLSHQVPKIHKSDKLWQHGLLILFIIQIYIALYRTRIPVAESEKENTFKKILSVNYMYIYANGAFSL